MTLQMVEVHRRYCDVCGRLGDYGVWYNEGWETSTYNGHEIDVCIAHRYEYTEEDKKQLSYRYPDPA